MTRPIHIDQLIKERIVPEDVVEYIEELEQENKQWRKDYMEQGDILAELLEEESSPPASYQSFQKGGFVKSEQQSIDQLKETSICVRLIGKGYGIEAYLRDLHKKDGS